ncbi:hypothetical protein FGO68_gene345 [Halteria grandinella]|uniref:dCMP deaminase n=1 Tax=Halteria grandinella TaxID=5974 RepID=A0A8J8NHB5_HALGN|nr:hypothetical protein FGO68_gene345 [Halteria grandinella]
MDKQRPADPSTYIQVDTEEVKPHTYYLGLACDYAKANSDDAVTQNGVLIKTVDNKLVLGANMVPGTVHVTPERTSRPLKYDFIEHGERTAIWRCALNALPTNGATLYQIWYPCYDCARAIIGAGIVEIVGIQRARDLTPAHWQENLKVAEVMLREAGVRVTMVEERVGVQMPFNGEMVEL